MISYVLLYDWLPDSFFLHHVLLLNRFTTLRLTQEGYGAMLEKQPCLADAEFVSMSGAAPGSARRMLEQGRKVLLDRNVDIKNSSRLLLFNMRYYPADWAWFNHVLEKLNCTDLPLIVLHFGQAALVGACWNDSWEDINGQETAVIENSHERLVDIGRTDNVLQLVSGNFSLRYFNSLRFGRPGYFQKHSSDIRKIHMEHSFLSSLPSQVRPFFPIVGEMVEDVTGGGYEIEIIPAFDVARLLLNGRFAESQCVENLMKALETYLDACPRRKCMLQEYSAKMRALFVVKTQERMDALARLPVSAKLDLTCRLGGFDSLAHFTAEHLALCEKSIAEDSGDELVFSHGDLFFSNILFDPLAGKIKLIDPRGGDGEAAFLPIWYDLAKLSHSFLGRYDMLVYGEFSIVMENDLSLHVQIADKPGADSLEKRFIDFLGGKKIDLGKSRLFEASLFLSMLPLHADSPLRMQGQLLRALDIHKRLTTPGASLYGV